MVFPQRIEIKPLRENSNYAEEQKSFDPPKNHLNPITSTILLSKSNTAIQENLSNHEVTNKFKLEPENERIIL